MMVGPGRVERPTSRLSGVRSNHLSYEPPGIGCLSKIVRSLSGIPDQASSLAGDRKRRQTGKGAGEARVCRAPVSRP